MGLWFLERKRKRHGWTLKQRRLLRAEEAVRLAHAALTTVTYQRQAFDGPGWRVTVDRSVSSAGLTLSGVIVEIKGHCPSWLKSSLPKPAKQFSKSRWALNRSTSR